MSSAVSFQNVSKAYGELQALKGVSFEVEKGSFFGLLGPNGAGKSTLINSMAGLVKPSGGHILVNGYDTEKSYRQTRRQLGLVPQELISDPFFSIKDLLKIQSGYFGLSGSEQDKWINELLERLALTDKSDAMTNQLSGGMKRRVLIAMALVHKPDVIVLDEPTAGVDVDLRKTLWEFTKELHQKGHTIILTTHYLEEAESLCEKVAILQKGQLKALETTSDLVSLHPYRYVRVNLSQRFEESFLASHAALSERLDSFNVNEVVFKVEKDLPLNDIMAWLSATGLHIKDITSRDATLEEVFITLTGEQNDEL
ncbi:ABC transporter ATP-binding protein [Hydrogenovibrio kuenenii]|uniref:ABC transporter ATP-binding protein n=1 Tax=Hydrogenovibrio kuenenii TaxID=63658 RepID=UPI00046445A1|nr:ABC transporter ATP-binding protein [Hydrogenovibrio kuenenii]